VLLVSAGAAHAGDARAGIAAVNAEFEAAAAKGDGKAIAALYTPDAQLLPEGSPAITGAAALAKFFQGVLDSGVAGVGLKTLEVYGRGTTVTEVGEYEMRDKAGKALDHGKYLVIWRNKDGQWRLHRDMFTSSVAPAQ
jgi:uncharacterized protein (TIGR02246 family)